MGTKPPAQIWEGEIAGRAHRVELSGDFFPRATWYVDGEQVADGSASERKSTLHADEVGRVVVRTSTLGKGRRATVLGPDELVGGVDLSPEPDSPAARYEARMVAHPTRHTLLATGGAVAAIVVPIVLVAVLVALARLIPWPDLPSIPWPDLPSIPWPDLPDVTLPGWLRWLLDMAPYVVPVVIAFAVARAEIRRRRQHQERASTSADDAPRSTSRDQKPDDEEPDEGEPDESGQRPRGP
ncbi:hypothetical protein FXB39_12230 [Nocardioides sp. BGMRC 2183]|nr:hypothetical protein FXB39_12230 [Nocardioides sp. BGMRC 2183]